MIRLDVGLVPEENPPSAGQTRHGGRELLKSDGGASSGTMKTFSRLPPLPRPHGGALRVLTACVAVMSLGVIGWLMTLPADLQRLYGMAGLLSVGALWLVVIAVWLLQRFRASHPLARNGLALAVLGLLLVPFLGPLLGGLLIVAGLILWTIGLSM